MPTIGILLCGNTPPESLQKVGPYEQSFVQMIEHNHPAFWQFVIWRCYQGEIPESADACDSWIVTGSLKGVYDSDPWIQRLMMFIRKLDKYNARLLGICFGHQLVHQALGGHVEKSEKGWGTGCYPVTLAKPFAGFPAHAQIRLPAFHQDQVITMAPGFECLAGSDFCQYAMTTRGHILTMQAHPELDNAMYKDFCERNRDTVGTEQIDQAYVELRQPDDRASVRLFLEHYLRPAQDNAHN